MRGLMLGLRGPTFLPGGICTLEGEIKQVCSTSQSTQKMESACHEISTVLHRL